MTTVRMPVRVRLEVTADRVDDELVWTVTDAVDAARLVTARQTRRVDVTLLVEIAATIHQLNVTLQPHF